MRRRTPSTPTLAGVAVAGLLVSAPPSVTQQRDQDLVADRSKGAPNAPVVVYEMADLQCPACRAFATQIFPTLDREYVATGKVRWVFVNLPLTELHKNAFIAAEVAMCAARQHRFWATHDLMYQHQSEWASLADARGVLVDFGVRAGADRAKLTACVASGATRPAIRSDSLRAARSGAQATPSFYIHGWLLQGSPPNPDGFRHILDSVYLARRQPQ